MKKIVLAIITTLYFGICFSQDTIIKKSGEHIQSKVLEITTTEIKYKKFENQDGPAWGILKSDVLMIRYANGKQDVFSEPNQYQEQKQSSTENPFGKGQADAPMYYWKYKGAGTGTLIASLVSPLVGLIPAISCSSTSPKQKNLSYPSGALLDNPDYIKGYTKRAKKIKQGKVWTNWGIGFAANLALVLIIASKK